MSRKHSVFHLLATSGNQAPLAANKDITELKPGQIGVFDAETNLSIANGADPRNFFIAVGLNPDGGQEITDVKQSEGYLIQTENLTYYTYKPYSAARNMKVLFKDYLSECDTEYGIKIQLSNGAIYREYGMNRYLKTYMIKTECCDGCLNSCLSGDANYITKQLLDLFEADSSSLFTAKAVAREALTSAKHKVSKNIDKGAEVSKEDLEKLIEYNKTQKDSKTYVFTDLELETVGVNIKGVTGYNSSYIYPRQTFIQVSKVGEFKCTGDVEILQTLANEEGSGKDLLNIEYFEKGNTESPYRQSESGFFKESNYLISANQKYDMITLGYEQKSLGGWLKYLMDQHTLIAIPAEDTTTRNGLLEILDSIVGNKYFDTLQDEAKASTTDLTDVEQVTKKNNKNKDGIA